MRLTRSHRYGLPDDGLASRAASPAGSGADAVDRTTAAATAGASSATRQVESGHAGRNGEGPADRETLPPHAKRYEGLEKLASVLLRGRDTGRSDDVEKFIRYGIAPLGRNKRSDHTRSRVFVGELAIDQPDIGHTYWIVHSDTLLIVDVRHGVRRGIAGDQAFQRTARVHAEAFAPVAHAEAPAQALATAGVQGPHELGIPSAEVR